MQLRKCDKSKKSVTKLEKVVQSVPKKLERYLPKAKILTKRLEIATKTKKAAKGKKRKNRWVYKTGFNLKMKSSDKNRKTNYNLEYILKVLNINHDYVTRNLKLSNAKKHLLNATNINKFYAM